MSVVEDVAEVEGFESALAPWWSFTKTVLAAAALALRWSPFLGQVVKLGSPL